MKTKTVVGLEIYTPKQRWYIGVAMFAAFALIAWVLHTKMGPGDHLVIWITYLLGCAAMCWRLRSRRKNKTPRR